MARAATITGLSAGMSFRASMPAVFGVRIAELWSWSRHLPEPSRVTELHDMRIAAKRLRYCFEFYAPCFGRELKPALERFKKLQDYLGEIHDCDVWADKLKIELEDYAKALRRGIHGLSDALGASADCIKAAMALRRQLAAPGPRGLLLLLGDVSRRRQRLHRELRAYWDELEAGDFRGELIRSVAKAAARQDAAGVVEDDEKPAAPVTLGASGFEVAAALDIGSNSVKLLVLELQPEGSYRILHDESRVTGLGRGLSQGGALSAEAISTTLDALAEMAATAQALGAARIVAAGTAALRSCGNPEALLGPLREKTGVEARVISGAEEARLSQAAALAELRVLEPGLSGSGLFFDLGGGSLELSSLRLEPGQRPRVLESVSLPAGARRLTELAGITHPVAAAAAKALTDLIEEQLGAAPVLAEPPMAIAGLGGTASVLVWLRQGLEGHPPADPHGSVVSQAWLSELIARLAPLTAEQMRALPNLDPLRADIIYAGARIVQALLQHYGAASFRLIDRGLRFGLLLAP